MTTLVYVNDSIDLEEVTVVILSNEMRKMGFVSEVQAEAEGLVTHRKTKRNGFGRSHQDFECHYYHKKGHIKVNCLKLKKKKTEC